jgi:hypothetical protein
VILCEKHQGYDDNPRSSLSRAAHIRLQIASVVQKYRFLFHLSLRSARDYRDLPKDRSHFSASAFLSGIYLNGFI